MPTSFFQRRGGEAGAPKPATTIRVGHVYLDTQHRLLYCLNETARALVREGVPISRDDLARQPLQTLSGQPVGPDDLPLYRAWREGASQEVTFVMSRPGVVQHLTWHATPLPGEDGQLQGVMASICVNPPEPDWRYAAGLAHDLRTPLQAMRLLVPALEAMPLLHPGAVDALERLRASADRAQTIGMDLLDWLSCPTSGARRIERSLFDLAPLLDSLFAEQVSLAQRKGIALQADLAEAEGLHVHTDRARLQRLLANLLSNAVRYTSIGQVRFSASWRFDANGNREALTLAVADTGAGISPEDQESIFQPFERGKAGKEGDSGSGLGLAVVDRLVKELGLTLEVFSEYGRGSTFELLLPPSILRTS
jgi:hypothetical protein